MELQGYFFNMTLLETFLPHDSDTQLNNLLLLPTAREGNVFTGICHSVYNRPCGYLFTTHPCYGAVGMHPTGMLSC